MYVHLIYLYTTPGSGDVGDVETITMIRVVKNDTIL